MVAREEGVETAPAFVLFTGVPALVDKCFGSARAGTKNQAIEPVLQYAEVENSGPGVVVRIYYICTNALLIRD